jgi:hypothetical protein
MDRRLPPEITARVLGLAGLLAAALVALGIADGVFARLGTELCAALAGFAFAFALATYALDPQVRGYVDALTQRQRGHLARSRTRLQPAVPALDGGTRGALDGQVEPAVRGAADDDVRRGKALAR